MKSCGRITYDITESLFSKTKIYRNNSNIDPFCRDLCDLQRCKGLSIKDVRRQGEGVIQCGQGEVVVLQMRTSAILGAKKFGFFEIYGVSARTRKKRTIFAILGGRLLWTAPQPNFKKMFAQSPLTYTVQINVILKLYESIKENIQIRHKKNPKH